jgi:hypothetical protein
MRISFAVLMLAATQMVGCASIINGQNQSLSVETRTQGGESIAGASCKLSNNKGSWFVTTPGSTTVQRSFEELAVKCEKDPIEPGLISVKSGTKAMAFGNILFGGFIGAGVDISTGAAYDYPALITVLMGKPATTTTVVITPTVAAPAQAAIPVAVTPTSTTVASGTTTK